MLLEVDVEISAPADVYHAIATLQLRAVDAERKDASAVYCVLGSTATPEVPVGVVCECVPGSSDLHDVEAADA